MEKDRTGSVLMAKRLRELRQKRGLTFDGLRNELLQYAGMDISVESLKNYEVSKEGHPRAYRNEGMRAELVRALATFYGVSTDYLLGISDIASQMDPAVSELKLSQKSVEWIKRKQEDCIRGKSFDLNVLFEDEVFHKLIDSLNECLAAISAQRISQGMFHLGPTIRSLTHHDEERETEIGEIASAVKEMVCEGAFGNDLIREKMLSAVQLVSITKEDSHGVQREMHTSQDLVDMMQYRTVERFRELLTRLRIGDLWNKKQINGIRNIQFRRDFDEENLCYHILVVENECNPKKRKIHKTKWRPAPSMTQVQIYKKLYSIGSEFAQSVEQE